MFAKGYTNIRAMIEPQNLKTATCKITIYHNTDYINKGQSSIFKRKKTCRLNVVNFDTLN